jgi:hypothetical protein
MSPRVTSASVLSALTRVLNLVAVIGVCAACTSGVATSIGGVDSTPMNPTSETSTDMSDTTLTLLRPPPSSPPQVTLNVAFGGMEKLQKGVLYISNWDGAQVRPGTQVPWPPAVDVQDDVLLQFASDSVPRLILVQGFVDEFSIGGEPVGKPVYKIECDKDQLESGTGPCALAAYGIDRERTLGLKLGLPEVRDQLRLAVQIMWVAIPSEDVTGEEDKQLFLSGTWLFAVK